MPFIKLNAYEAERNGLLDGAVVLLKSSVGEVRVRLQIDANLRRDVVITERGGWTKAGHGLNLLASDMASKVGNGTPFYETSVSVLPISERSRKILVVQNSERAPGGTFCKELERLGVSLTVVRPANGEALPVSPGEFDGLVVLGGPQHAFDDKESPYFESLMQLMRDFDEVSKPVAGICLGCQLLARAHGSSTWNMETLEFGFVEHAFTQAAKSDPVLGEIDSLPPLMEFHEDSFDLPEGASLLVKGDSCPNQCFRVGHCSYGFQFHLEVDSVIANHWTTLFQSGAIGAYVNYREQYNSDFFTAMSARFPILVADSEAFCRKVARQWLTLGIDQ